MPRGESRTLGHVKSPAAGLSTVPGARDLRLPCLLESPVPGPFGEPGPRAIGRARRPDSPRQARRRALHSAPWRRLSTCGLPASWMTRRPDSPRCPRRRAFHSASWRGLSRVSGLRPPASCRARSGGHLESPAAGLSTAGSPPGSPQCTVARALRAWVCGSLPRGESGPLAIWRARRPGSPQCVVARALKGARELRFLASWRARHRGHLESPGGRALHGALVPGPSTVHRGADSPRVGLRDSPCGESGPRAIWRARRPDSPRCPYVGHYSRCCGL